MKMMKKKHDYQLARELIVRHLSDGKYKLGDKLPSRTKMAEVLDIGLISVQKAIKALEEENVLYNIKGSGCYLKSVQFPEPPETTSPISVSDFDSEIFFGHYSGKNSKLNLKFALFPGELNFWGGEWKRVIAEFEKKNHGTSIEPIPVGSIKDLQENLSRKEIDIFQIPLRQVPLMVKTGFLLSIGNGLEIDEQNFFKPIHKASCYKGKVCGMPLAVNCCCLFHLKKWEDLIYPALRAGGFWKFMEKIEHTSIPFGAEALIANNHTLDDLFRLVSVTLKADDIDTDAVIAHPDFMDFILHIDKYYRNPEIFNPNVRPSCEDSIHSLASGLSVTALGNSSWMSMLRRIQAEEWDISEEPHESATFKKVAGVLYAASSLTCYPEECIAFLNHLGTFETQRTFAKSGVLTARRDACMEANVKGLGRKSIDTLMAIIEAGHVPIKDSDNSNDFLEKIFYQESVRWASGKLSTKEFLDSIRRKREIFIGR